MKNKYKVVWEPLQCDEIELFASLLNMTKDDLINKVRETHINKLQKEAKKSNAGAMYRM